MTFTISQKKEAYKKLPQEAQDFIMDNETTELITNYLKEAEIYDEQSNSADSEILYAMYGLQTLSEAIQNIAKLSNKNINDLSKLKNNLENNIFSKIQSYKNTNTPRLSENKIGEGIQNIKLDKTVENRVREIAKKYALNNIQVEKLVTIIGSDIKQAKGSSILLETIIADLSISRLLAEQIMQDLENRVFEYALSRVTSNDVRNTKDSENPAMSKGIFDIDNSKQQVVSNAVPTQVKPAQEVMSKTVFDIKTSNQNQAVVSRTRLDTKEPQIPEIAPKILPMVEKKIENNRQQVANNKENQIPSSPTPPTQTNLPTEQTGKPITKSYTVDPYREPLS